MNGVRMMHLRHTKNVWMNDGFFLSRIDDDFFFRSFLDFLILVSRPRRGFYTMHPKKNTLTLILKFLSLIHI